MEKEVKFVTDSNKPEFERPTTSTSSTWGRF